MLVNILGFLFSVILLGVLTIYAWKISRKLQPWLRGILK